MVISTVDPRDPLLRMECLLDPQTIKLLTQRDQSGMVLPSPMSLCWHRREEFDLGALVPDSRKRTYEVHPLINSILDHDGESLEILPVWAENMSTVLGRLGGRTVGVVANNPQHMAGVLDSAAAEKAARFVRTCDAFGEAVVPRVTLITRRVLHPLRNAVELTAIFHSSFT